ncbi:hypothetical protein D9M69_715510 [compost metagenome]
MVVGGDEHHQRHLAGGNRTQCLEAIHPRHLHIEEHQVRPVFAQTGDGRCAIAILADNVDVGMRGQADFQPAPGQRFVVDDEGAQSWRAGR